ncbi:hypothetical protein [Streptomyces sp. AcH 505]|uniref:hypothetical protein n=1 Tax=Streptomyces sp. AcH 505 TaxID=352211 RepID=UPI0012FF4E15
MRAWRAVGAAGLIVGLGAGVLGCGGDKPAEPKTIAAGAACHGAVSSAAAKSVEFLTGVRKFALDSPGDDPAKAASALADTYVPGKASSSAEQVCSIDDATQVGNSYLSIDLRFGSEDESNGVGASADLARYAVGRSAYTKPGFADLYFDCVSGKLRGSTKKKPAIVAAALQTGPTVRGKYQPKSASKALGEANLVVVNSVALKVAQELGCAGNGGLEAELTLKPAEGE